MTASCPPSRKPIDIEVANLVFRAQFDDNHGRAFVYMHQNGSMSGALDYGDTMRIAQFLAEFHAWRRDYLAARRLPS